MKNKELKKKNKNNERKKIFFLIIWNIGNIIIIFFLVAFFCFKKNKNLSNKYNNEVVNNLSHLFKEKNFTKKFDTIHEISVWLLGLETTCFGEEINKLNDVLRSIRSTLGHNESWIEELKNSLTNYKNIFEKDNKKDNLSVVDRLKKKFPTEEEKKNEFIESFKNLFIFNFLRELGEIEDGDGFCSEKNENVLFRYNDSLFSSLTEQSQELMWKKFSMNIIILFTLTDQKWIKMVKSVFVFSLNEAYKNNDDTPFSFVFLTQQQEKETNYLNKLDNKKFFEEEIQNFPNKVSKLKKNCNTYKNKVKELTIIESSLRQKAYEEFKIVFETFVNMCILVKKIIILDLLDQTIYKNFFTHYFFFVNYFTFLFLLLPKNTKDTFEEDFLSSTNY